MPLGITTGFGFGRSACVQKSLSACKPPRSAKVSVPRCRVSRLFFLSVWALSSQMLSGRKAVTGREVRRGLESLAISQARWRQLGLPDFAADITGISCTDHNGHQAAYVQQWDGAKWSRVSGWISPMTERLRPLLQAAVTDYVSRDPAWPKRTEPCDKSS